VLLPTVLFSVGSFLLKSATVSGWKTTVQKGGGFHAVGFSPSGQAKREFELASAAHRGVFTPADIYQITCLHPYNPLKGIVISQNETTLPLQGS